MTSWNRRVAAASRVRPGTDGDESSEPLASLGLPDDLHPDDLASVRALLRVAQIRRGGFSTTLVGRVAGKDGGVRKVQIVVMGNDNGVTTLVGDNDPELVLDPLTGLPGREYLLEMVDGSLRDAQNADHVVGLFAVDVDRFKTVNDTHGYRAGDEALRFLATRIEEELRPDDVLTRLSGDEFTVLCPDVLGLAEAVEIGERLRAVCADLPIDSPLAGLSISVGISIGGTDRAAEEMLHEAQTALYRAKGLGRDRCEVFDDELRSLAERRNSVDQRLRRALDDDSIHVHYQPIIDVATRRIVGAEALLRIIDDDGGHLDPVELIRAAEDSGLIRRIDEMVLERAAAAVRDLPTGDGEDDEPVFLSVNISDRRLDDSRFPLALARSLHNASLPAERVHLELGPQFLEHANGSKRLLTQLRTLGVGIAIDEYMGTSENDLIDAAVVDHVKLDKRLVHGLQGERGQARAELVIGGLTDRDVNVCAVGVETEADLDAIAELGCRLAQGYLFSPPVDAARLAALIAAGEL